MDSESLKHLWALQKVNEALLTGLETAIHTMENWDDLSKERRRSIIESIKKLISQSNTIYGTKTTKH